MRKILNDNSVEFVLTEDEMQVVLLAIKNLKNSLPNMGDVSNV